MGRVFYLRVMQGSSAGTNKFHVNSARPLITKRKPPPQLPRLVHANGQTVGLHLFMCHAHDFDLVCSKQTHYLCTGFDHN
jgi:hypothetical protein